MDYDAGQPRTVIIRSGDTEACINFTIINDDLAREPNERFEVRSRIPEPLATVVNLTDPTSTVTIIDEDREFIGKALL